MAGKILEYVVNRPDYLRNKEEVVYSLKRYLKTCEVVEENWSQTRKSEILKIISSLLQKVLNMSLPELQGLGWSYVYLFENDGMYLRLQHSMDFAIDEVEDSFSRSIKEDFALVRQPYEYLTVRDYAKLYGVNEVTVRQWIRRGKLRSAVKRGGEWFIPSVEDRPRRGYTAVSYEWESALGEIVERFPFLSGHNSLDILQNKTDKGIFEVALYCDGRLSKQIQMGTSQREMMELALIEHPNIKGEAWYDLDIIYPEKERESIIESELKWVNDATDIEGGIDMMEEDILEFNVESSQSEWDGVKIWNFSAELALKAYTDDSDESKPVVELKDGMIIPSSIEVEDKGFCNLLDFGDSISGDLLEVCTVLIDGENGGMKEKILQDIGEEWIDSCAEKFMYIQDISCKEIKYLRIFLNNYDEYKQGLPDIDACQLVAVLLKWDMEKEKVKAFIDAGWKIQATDSKDCMVAYRGRKLRSK